MDALDLDAFELAVGDVADPGPPDFLSGVADRAATVVIVDGHLSSVDLSPEAAKQGVTVRSAGEGDDDAHLADVADPDALTALHDAFVADVVLIEIPNGVVVGGPIVVTSVAATEGAASFPHVVVHAGEQSEATVLSYATSTADLAYVNPVFELRTGGSANLRYVEVQDLGPSIWQTGYLVAVPGRDANIRAWVLALGGEFARLYIDAELIAQGSSVDVRGVYFGEDHQTLDFRSLQNHAGSRSRSDLLLKGAVVDDAHGVYTGLIRVQEGAKATDSFLANRNLVLADGAHVDSVPNLEIVNENDIRSCGHASATGPVDPDHVFYLESRGVPTEVAQRLIVFGFFDEVVTSVPVPGVVAPLRAAVARKLQRAEVAHV